jgi:hypothetical protein
MGSVMRRRVFFLNPDERLEPYGGPNDYPKANLLQLLTRSKRDDSVSAFANKSESDGSRGIPLGGSKLYQHA